VSLVLALPVVFTNVSGFFSLFFYVHATFKDPTSNRTIYVLYTRIPIEDNCSSILYLFS
jgi:hypothetical protein